MAPVIYLSGLRRARRVYMIGTVSQTLGVARSSVIERRDGRTRRLRRVLRNSDRSRYETRPGYTLEDGSGCLTIGVHLSVLERATTAPLADRTRIVAESAERRGSAIPDYAHRRLPEGRRTNPDNASSLNHCAAHNGRPVSQLGVQNDATAESWPSRTIRS
jgi:hypothetical protein